MKLEDIGFYTLSDYRASVASTNSRMMRAEILLGNRCNFSCPYCRNVGGPDISLNLCYNHIIQLAKNDLFAIRFSGGEPTIHPHIVDFVKFSKDLNIEKVAISTNGSADIVLYDELIDCGVNDFSVSLDSCCSSDAEKMSGGGISGMWDQFVENVKYMAKRTYLTVGIVLNEDNKDKVNDIIVFADSLGVSDIRVIPAAQDSNSLSNFKVDDDLLLKYPILRYRYNNIKNNVSVRGLSETDYHRCPLVLDDVAIMGENHYPCIIYMREGGDPIGNVDAYMRDDREKWFNHDTYEDHICRNQCLDVCRDYCAKWEWFHS